jgi:endonuclease YncB( thermonuclease family)
MGAIMKYADALLLVFIIGLGLFASHYASERHALSGAVRVIDGDTIEFIHSGTHVRLAGIDAPEARQPCMDHQDCGLMATVHLLQLIGNARVLCQQVGEHDQYHRVIANCFISANLTDTLNARMVIDGYALDYPRYSQGRFAADQERAMKEGYGLWAHGGFQTPWRWREVHKSDNAFAR